MLRRQRALEAENIAWRERWRALGQMDDRAAIADRLHELERSLAVANAEAERFQKGYARSESVRAALHERVARLTREVQTLEMNRSGLETLYRLMMSDRDSWRTAARGEAAAETPVDLTASDPEEAMVVEPGGTSSNAASGTRIVLRDSQRGHFSASLRTVGTSLRRVSALIREGSASSLLREVRWDIPSALVTEYLRAESELLATLEEMVGDLGLTTDRTEASRVIQAHVTSMWEILEDLRPEKLTGYGPTDRDLYAYLTPRVDRAIQTVRRMQELLRRATDADPS